LKTAERLAKQHGVSRATIERDGRFAEAVEVVKRVDPQIESRVVQGSAPSNGAIVEAVRVLQKAHDEVAVVADLARSLNTAKSRVMEVVRGKGATTKAHWQIALAYAKYLSHEFHQVVHDAFREWVAAEVYRNFEIRRSTKRTEDVLDSTLTVRPRTDIVR
jgi:hypothetical protein